VPRYRAGTLCSDPASGAPLHRWKPTVSLLVAAALLLAGCAAERSGPGPLGDASSDIVDPPRAPDSASSEAPAAAPEPGPEGCPTDGSPGATRVAGEDRIATALALADAGWGQAGARTVVVASARDFPDALTATPWAAAHDAPLLLTEPEGLPGPVADTIDRLGAGEAVIVGGPSVVSEQVHEDLEDRGLTVRRLAGNDRFGTAHEIATDLHTSAQRAVLVTSHAFPDAVAAGPLVTGTSHHPIVLTRPDELPDSTRDTLTQLGVEQVTVVGGPGAVGPRVVAELEGAGITVDRVAGEDRYATSAAVVEEAATTQGGREVLAAVTGADFPDALAANAYAARLGATVLLVDHDDLIDHPATGAVLTASGPAWRCTTIVGGTTAIDPRVAEQIVARTGAQPPDGPPTLLTAGDIASCGLRSDEATATLLDGLAGTVLTLGDNAYDDGTAQQYADCYLPTWGRHLVRTRGSLGNHDIRTADGGPTYDFFGVRAGPRDQGWYAFDLGPHWRVLVINSNCPGTVRCDAGSQQAAWLRDQLAATTDRHVIVAAHHPRWSSGVYAPGEARVADLWRIAAEGGADLWLAGHEHGYERFAPKDAAGADDPAGVHPFTVGTGGASLREFGDPQPGSQVRLVTHGVLELTLRSDGYAWRFLDTQGTTRDEGEG